MTEEEKLSSDDPMYHQEYYQKHKKEIAERKARRYKEEPEYRFAILGRSRERRRKDAIKRKKKKKTAPPKDPMKPTNFKIFTGGREIETNMFTAGQLGLALERKTQTIRLWEKKGYLPEAMYRSTSGDRLYTELQLTLLTKAFAEMIRKHGRKAFTRIGSTEFPTIAKEIWQNYPLGIEE